MLHLRQDILLFQDIIRFSTLRSYGGMHGEIIRHDCNQSNRVQRMKAAPRWRIQRRHSQTNQYAKSQGALRYLHPVLVESRYHRNHIRM
mmetsp:Transcript_15233/g.42135  ORF Transcript_15233/g.42135 Transcript_15233/m.42135 type:complete len:89 (+) Transcript_15233:1017-1283(+)